MHKTTQGRSKKSGLPPGSLIYIGEKKVEKVKIHVFNYNENQLEEKEITNLEDCHSYKSKPGVTWINIEGLDDTTVLEGLGNIFDIHPLALEDILNTEQRPKKEDFQNNIYIVLKMLTFNDKKNKIITEQVSLILGSNYVISFQEGIEGDVFNPLRERIRKDKGSIRSLGSDYLVYSLVDAIIDNYFFIVEKLGERIQALESEMIKRLSNKHLEEIHAIKKEIILLHKYVWPLREVVNSLVRDESALVKNSTRIYLRDVYDHIIQIIETIDLLRETISIMIEIYLSGTSNRLNEVIRVLTIISTIFMPPTFIVGIYGMNFKYFPELEWKWGYPLVMLLMVTVSMSMFFYFKRKKWI